MRRAPAILAALLIGTAGALSAQAAENMSFFVTSANPGNGADLGGLEGADGSRPSISGKISKVSGDLVFLNMGSNKGVKVGDTFTVYALGEEIIDPDTGESLGSEETKVGTVEVIEVKEKYSKARVTGGSGMTAGSSVR